MVRIKCLDPGKVYVTRVPVRCISEEKNDPRARHIICESWGQEPTTTEGNVIGESSPGEMMEKGEHDGKERKEIKRRVGGENLKQKTGREGKKFFFFFCGDKQGVVGVISIVSSLSSTVFFVI